MDLEQHLFIYLFWKHVRIRHRPCANTSAVGCFWSRKELPVLAALWDCTTLRWLNQSFSGSRWHFVCAPVWLLSIYCPSLLSTGGWLWQPAHQSGRAVETDEREQDHCSSNAGVQSCILQLLVRHDFTGAADNFFWAVYHLHLCTSSRSTY